MFWEVAARAREGPGGGVLKEVNHSGGKRESVQKVTGL